MKKLFIATTLSFIGIITFQSCRDKKITDAKKAAIIEEYLKAGNGFYCDPCVNQTTTKISDYLLDANMLKEMTDLYNQLGGTKKISNQVILNRAAGNSKTMADSVDDSRAIWFSLERLKGFITEIEKATCGKKCDSLKLGIRMYYARYPNPSNYKIDLKNVPDSFENRHTIFMVPTYDSAYHHVDFDPRYFNKTSCWPTSLISAFDAVPQQKTQSGVNMFGFSPTVDQQSMNHGDLIPPPYNDFYRYAGAYFLK
jgi:hypothetical protein